MKKTLSLAAMLALACGFAAKAQTISDADIRQMRDSFQRDNATVAAQNALTSTANIQSLVRNHELDGKIDHYFKYRVDVQGSITDQKQSGRCWMFTSMNVLRPAVMKRYGLADFDFSHSYLYFWDILEKSNLFLENVIATASRDMDDREVARYFSAPVDDGGVWNLYYNLGIKYGVVPATVMPETPHSENTAQMMALIKEKLRREGYALRQAVNAAKGKRTKAVEQQKAAALNDIYRMLALCLGEPPVEFEWRYRTQDGEVVSKHYTPQEFYAEITPDDYSPENYVMIMNDPTREYYKLYEIANYRNTVEGVNWVYLNLPNEVIKQAALASIKHNEAMYASCDVNKYLDRVAGLMDPSLYDYEALFGVELSMDKKARILTRQSGSSHAMTLIGVDTDENDVPVKWEFENSWGPQYGNHGYLTFTDDWFDEYMFRLVVHKKYLDQKSVEALDQEPVQLPVWDYMF